MKFTKAPDTCVLEKLKNRFLSLIILIASTNPSDSYCCYFSLGYNFLLLPQVLCFKFFESLMCVLTIFTLLSFFTHSVFILSFAYSLSLLHFPSPISFKTNLCCPVFLDVWSSTWRVVHLTTMDYTLRENSLSSQQLTFAHRSAAWVESSTQLFFPY